jgi:hypothetical protein
MGKKLDALVMLEWGPKAVRDLKRKPRPQKKPVTNTCNE